MIHSRTAVSLKGKARANVFFFLDSLKREEQKKVHFTKSIKTRKT